MNINIIDILFQIDLRLKTNFAIYLKLNKLLDPNLYFNI